MAVPPPMEGLDSESPITMTPDARTVAFALPVLHFSTPPGDRGRRRCMACDSYLDLHQPDHDSPDRLVGNCTACGRLYLIDSILGTDETTMVLLPDGKALLQAHMGCPR